MATSATPAAVAPKPPAGFISNPVELVKPSFEAVKLNWKTLVIATLIPLAVGLLALIVLGGGALAGVAFHFSLGPVAIVAGLLLLLVALVVFALVLPILPVTLLHSARGQKIGFKEAYEEGRPYLWRLIGTGILTGLAVIGGLILFIIPGLIFLAWFTPAIYVVIDENLDVIAAMKRSKQLVQGHVWEMLGMQALPQVVSFIGIIPVVGFIVSFLFGFIFSAAPAVRYLQLKEFEGQATPTHWLNYVLVFLVPISLAGGSALGHKADPYPAGVDLYQ